VLLLLPAQLNLLKQLKQVALQIRQLDLWQSRQPLEVENPETGGFHNLLEFLGITAQNLSLNFMNKPVVPELVFVIKVFDFAFMILDTLLSKHCHRLKESKLLWIS
jgi:hypothetical protein